MGLLEALEGDRIYLNTDIYAPKSHPELLRATWS